MRRLHEADISRGRALARRAGAHARCLPPQVRRWQTRRVRTVPQRGCRASGRFRRRGPANVCRRGLGHRCRKLGELCVLGVRSARSTLQTQLLSAWATLHLLLLTHNGVAPPARREGRLAVAPCSEESCRVFSAHYIVAFLRGCAVLASRRELQNKGVLEPDCPVCLDMLAAGNGVVTFHILECGHRCEAVAAVRLLTATQSPHGRMCSVPEHHPHARSPAACVAGSTKSACSRSRRGGPRLARCACARSAESRRAQSTPLSFGAKWRDDATAAIARARNVGSLSLTLERDAAGELSGTPHNSRYFHVSTLMSGVLRLPPSRMRTLNNRAPRCGA